MAQTGFTPIVTYNTATATTVPSAANLAQGELAVNVTDKKLYTKDSGGNVVLLASNGGDVTGPATSTNLAIPTFSGTGGKTLLDNSGATISAGVITATGFSGPLTGNVTGNVSGSSGSCTGNASTVTTNANLTGPITSVGNATSIASQTGTGTKFVMDTSPTITGATLTTAALNGSLGATTPSTVVATSVGITNTFPQTQLNPTGWTATRTYYGAGLNTTGSGSGNYIIAGTETGKGFGWEINAVSQMVLDTSGNFGINVLPFANTGKLAVKGNISLTDGTVQGTSTEAVQTTSTITTAKTIIDSVAPALSSAAAASIYVYGSNNASAYFFDKLVCIANAAAPVVLSSTTLGGAPAARTYALSGGALTLAMASGTYSVTAKTVALGYPF